MAQIPEVSKGQFEAVVRALLIEAARPINPDLAHYLQVSA